VDKSAAALQLYKYGRRPYIFFVAAIAATSLLLHIVLGLKFVRGVNPPNPEWKESISQLQSRMAFLFRNLVYSGSFVLGISQAVKKQQDIFNPNLAPVLLYGKLLVILLLAEFVCNLLLSPRGGRGKEPDAAAHSMPFLHAVLSWVRGTSRDVAEQMISGAATGFGYGYLVRGVGVLFRAYETPSA
jgi:hypothetical protein